MNTQPNIYGSSTLQAFCSIDKGAHREKIRFFNSNRADIHNLPLDEYVLVLDGYAVALFETGRYHKYLRVADELIRLSMEYNIVYLDEKDLYFDTLFQKAASYYNLRRTDKAILILRQLMAIQPDNESVRLFLINCYVRKGASRITTIRKWCVVAIMASAGIIAIELLLIRPFVEAAVTPVELTRNTLFLTSALTLLGAELWVRYRAVMSMIRDRKSQSGNVAP